jgi:hypothetical protein
MLRLTCALAAAGALAIAGCGGGQGDKEKIESTVNDYFTAFADGDSNKVCDQLSKSTQQTLTKASKVRDCPGAITAATQRPEIKRFVDQLRDAKVLSVKITGDDATARVRALGSETNVPLRKEGSDWKIESPLGAR